MQYSIDNCIGKLYIIKKNFTTFDISSNRLYIYLLILSSLYSYAPTYLSVFPIFTYYCVSQRIIYYLFVFSLLPLNASFDFTYEYHSTSSFSHIFLIFVSTIGLLIFRSHILKHFNISFSLFFYPLRKYLLIFFSGPPLLHLTVPSRS